MEESFAALDFSRSRVAESRTGRLMFGRTNRFCLEGGRISSRSTGTPNETRKSRRILERVQFGGCIGGGDTSCCHRERERSERKGEELLMSRGGSSSETGGEEGNMASR